MENNDVASVLKAIRGLLKAHGIYVSRINAFYIHNSNKAMVVYSYPIRVFIAAKDSGIDIEISEMNTAPC